MLRVEFGIHLDNGTIANTDHQNYLSTTGEQTSKETGEETGVGAPPTETSPTQRANALLLHQRSNAPPTLQCSTYALMLHQRSNAPPALRRSNAPPMLQCSKNAPNAALQSPRQYGLSHDISTASIKLSVHSMDAYMFSSCVPLPHNVNNVESLLLHALRHSAFTVSLGAQEDALHWMATGLQQPPNRSRRCFL